MREFLKRMARKPLTTATIIGLVALMCYLGTWGFVLLSLPIGLLVEPNL